MTSLILKFATFSSVSATLAISFMDKSITDNRLILALIAVSFLASLLMAGYSYLNLMQAKINLNKRIYFKILQSEDLSLFRRVVLANPKKAAKYISIKEGA